MDGVLDRRNCLNFMMMPIDLAILEKGTLVWMDNVQLFVWHTDGEITRIDLLSRRIKYNKFSFIRF